MFAPKISKGKSAVSNAIANAIQKKPKGVKMAPVRKATSSFTVGTTGGAIAQHLRKVSQGKVAAKLRHWETLSKNQKTKQDAQSKADQAENATVAPVGEGAAMSNAGQVEAVEGAAAPNPKEAAAQKEMQAAMQKALPKTLEAADKFKQEGKGKRVGDAAKKVVGSDTEAVRGTYQEIEKSPAPVPPQPKEELPEIEAAPNTSNVPVGEGVVGATLPEQQDRSAAGKESDDQIKKEGIKEEELNMVTDGELADAKKERTDLKKQVQNAPAEIKATEQKEQKGVQQNLQKEAGSAQSAMKQKRQNQLKKARNDQQKGKSTLEKKREAVTQHINNIYTRANLAVKAKLQALEQNGLKAFEVGQIAATTQFENNVKRRMDKFKSDRYDVFGGSVLWLKDKFLGMDDLPQVKLIFDEERQTFVTTLDMLIKNISEANKKGIQDCKAIIAAAKQEIAQYVRSLGPALQSTAKAAQKDIQGKLNALDNEVNAAQKKWEEALAQKREAAIKAIDEKIAKMKEAMKGALGKLAGLIFEALMKFFKWALKQAGMNPEALISKVSSTIKAIVKNPKGFLSNLVKAVKGGVFNFRDNIKTHLIKGLMDWITNGLQGAGITLPTVWDLKGIVGLVLQILGLTWANIRRHLVDKLGEKVVSFVEKAIEMGEKALEIFKKIRAGGFGAIWDMIKDKAEEIKGMIMDKIKDFIANEVIKAGIIKLVSMLNPAGAIAQAIMGIYNAVMFFVENGSRLAAFVSSIFDGIASIAAGSLGAASNAVEGALAKTIPIIINFVARLAGLGNLGAKVAKVIQAIQKPVNMVLEKLAGFVAKIVKPLLEKGMAFFDKVKGKIVGGIKAIIEWWKIKVAFKGDDGKNHSVFLEGNEQNAELMVASNKQQIGRFLSSQKKQIDQVTSDRKKNSLLKAWNAATASYQSVKKQRAIIKKETDSKVKSALKDKLNLAITETSQHLQKIMMSSPDEKKETKEAHDEVFKENSEYGRLLKGKGRFIDGHPGRRFTITTRQNLNAIGNKEGDHSSSAKQPGTTSKDWIPDHMPPDALYRAGAVQLTFRFYPHSLASASKQGGVVNGYKSQMERKMNQKPWLKHLQSTWFWS